jgi:hypothetical protein
MLDPAEIIAIGRYKLALQVGTSQEGTGHRLILPTEYVTFY